MIKTLVKKQLMEVFKGYFYDAKKNRARSKGSIIGWFIFFAVIMIGVLGGMFTMLASALCGGLAAAGAGWLYFDLMSGIAILLGAFGSVFNTYAGLYLSKDNDLLLSMPIPVKDIVASRLINVYVLGAIYSVVVTAPMLVVYWLGVGFRSGNAVSVVICGILLALIISVIVLLLSCLLGWVVAKVSLKLKRKSVVSVFIAILCIGLYYFCYFRASALIQEMIQNAQVYGDKVKGAAYGLYLFGRIGEGDWLATGVAVVITVILVFLIWRLLLRSFLSIATATGSVTKTVYVEKRAKKRTAFSAILRKEFSKFVSSSHYMLNCGLGVLFIIVAAVALLIKGPYLFTLLESVFGERSDSIYVLFIAMLMLLSAMIDTAAPSVSLEGKCIWIPKSLPVEPKQVLRAKMMMQLLLSGVPMLIAVICAAVVARASAVVTVLIIVVPLVFAVFNALFSSFLGIKMPNLTWTNEIMPIKQGGAVAIAILGIWAVAIVFAALFFLVGYRMGAVIYIVLWLVILVVASILLLRWLDTKGAKLFTEL